MKIKDIKTIQDVYTHRIEQIKEKNEAPKLILISPQQRHNLIIETKLYEKFMQISNITDTEFVSENKFKLFNIEISTEELQRK